MDKYIGDPKGICIGIILPDGPKREHEAVAVRSMRWLDALIESYERNISIHKTEYEHTGNKYYEGAADAYKDVLNDLRAETRKRI